MPGRRRGFSAVTLALLALYVVLRRRAQAASLARTHSRSLIADPFVVATGLQLVQAVGLKRALTLLAIVGGADCAYLEARGAPGVAKFQEKNKTLSSAAGPSRTALSSWSSRLFAKLNDAEEGKNEDDDQDCP